jgi:hypothetical protein
MVRAKVIGNDWRAMAGHVGRIQEAHAVLFSVPLDGVVVFAIAREHPIEAMGTLRPRRLRSRRQRAQQRPHGMGHGVGFLDVAQ